MGAVCASGICFAYDGARPLDLTLEQRKDP